MIRTFRLFFLLAFAGIFCFQVGNAQDMVKDPTTWTYEAKKTGEHKYQLIFHLKLKQDWHIWSITPGGDGLLVPPSFNFSKAPGLKLIGGIREKGKLIKKEFPGTDGMTNSYETQVDFVQEAEVKDLAKIKGKHEYQVCDHQQCLRPTTKAFSFDTPDEAPANGDTASTAGIAPAAADTAAIAPAIPAGSDSAKGTAAASTGNSNSGKATTENGGMNEAPTNIWLLFALCFGGGLLAITTPCVYSMVPITVSFFTKRSKDRAEAIRNAFYYSLSIIIIFTILGVLISAIFGPQALYKLSSNWIANLFFFIIFVIFGISFLGAFEITLPSSWTSRTDSKANTSSFKGIFFMAMTLVIVSFSCTSGIIGPLLVAASKGGIVGPAVGMFGFSLGLALPFTFFAFSPGLISKMANAGGWLNQVKVTLGFIELGLALKFFSNADLVRGWRILDREIFIAIWIVIAIMLGLYLLGKLKLSKDDVNPKNMFGQEYVSLFKLGLAFSSFLFAVYLVPGLFGAPLKGLGQFLPPMATQDFVISSGGTGHGSGSATESAAGDGFRIHPVKYKEAMKAKETDVVVKYGLEVFYDYEEALAASKERKKPVMLDFTGITCVNCRLMETNVWIAPDVMKRLKEDFVIASLYCDASQVPLDKKDQYMSKDLGYEVTNLGDRSLDLQVSRFQSNSQPFYYFVDENETRLAPKGYGTNTDVAKFVAHLEAVKAKYKELHP
jgi:thiol:disulfide interchange protein